MIPYYFLNDIDYLYNLHNPLKTPVDQINLESLKKKYEKDNTKLDYLYDIVDKKVDI
jgi:hypothetical protein